MKCPTCNQHDEFVFEENTRVWRCDRCHERFIIKPRRTNCDASEEFIRVATTNADRLRELAEADRDGRCVMLPCKVGDTLWNIKAVFSFYQDPKEETVDRFVASDDGSSVICRSGYKFRIERIGKTVFLTREAAEKALEATK